jgi:hypothetical protein
VSFVGRVGVASLPVSVPVSVGVGGLVLDRGWAHSAEIYLSEKRTTERSVEFLRKPSTERACYTLPRSLASI